MEGATASRLAGIEGNLLAAMEGFEVIDCHEHLGLEENRTSIPVDLFTLFTVCNYEFRDLALAGMSEADRQALRNQDIPLSRRWALFAPYWQRIRWGSYARAVLLAVQRFYGAEDINEHTYEAISEAMRQANKPGLYQRVLGDTCRIGTALVVRPQGQPTSTGTPLLTPLGIVAYEMETWEALSRPLFAPEASIRSLDDYLDALRAYVLRAKSEGAVGLKMVVSRFGEPERQEAISAFDGLRTGAVARLPTPNPLRDYVTDQIIAFAGEQGLVIAVHTGYWDDFRQLDPLHMIPLLQRHPKVRFDIYHLGYPWVRETLMLGKGFANVWLNFCWTHIISQRFATAAFDEAIDLIPTNKILGFGGDYLLGVEKVYGHLVMAREDIARVLAQRVVERRMTESQAMEIAHRWLWDNPRELYGLNV